MNQNDKDKQKLIAQSLQQLVKFGRNPENKHFIYLGIDGDKYNANDKDSGMFAVSGHMEMLAHILFEQRNILPYGLRVHMLAHILLEDTDIVTEAHNLIKSGQFPAE